MQNVGIPRFYVDYLQYYVKTGIVQPYEIWNSDTYNPNTSDEAKRDLYNLASLNPSSQVSVKTRAEGDSHHGFNYAYNIFKNYKNYCH